MNWISVDDRLPSSKELKKYRVKMIVGSMSPKEEDRVILGRAWYEHFRWSAGDWQRVTHWKELEE